LSPYSRAATEIPYQKGKLFTAKGLIFAAGLALAASTLSAQALPVGPADLGGDSLVTNVAQGCGPGWARNRWGECRPMRGPRYIDPRPRVVVPGIAVVPPRVMAPRRCWIDRFGRRVCR
jgi:hypothetical protein